MPTSLRLSNRLILAALLPTLLLAPAACTEPNPASDDETGTSGPTSATSGSEGTTASSTSTSGGTGSTGNPSTTTATDGPGTDSDPTSTGPGTDESSGTTGADSSGGETAPEPSCDGGNACVAGVPEGWNGPVARIEGEVGSTGACGGSFTELAFSANVGLTADPAACGCSCGAATGAACPSEVVIAHGGADAVCLGDGETTHTVGVACSQHAEAGDFYWRVLQPEVEGGSCLATSTTTVPPAGWTSEVTACGLANVPTSEGCAGDELCIPDPAAPFGGDVCIWMEGEQECPAGDYQDRTVYYDDFADARGCSACTCGEPTGSCSEPEVRVHPNTSCACVSAAACNVGTTCEQLSFGDVDSMDLRVPPVLVGEASCASADVGPVGEATPMGATTVCCAG